MTAVRIPLLGMAVAVALLVAETFGALAYRDHAIATSGTSSVDVQHQAAVPSRVKRVVPIRAHRCIE
jgi:hypothetical protein